MEVMNPTKKVNSNFNNRTEGSTTGSSPHEGGTSADNDHGPSVSLAQTMYDEIVGFEGDKEGGEVPETSTSINLETTVDTSFSSTNSQPPLRSQTTMPLAQAELIVLTQAELIEDVPFELSYELTRSTEDGSGERQPDSTPNKGKSPSKRRVWAGIGVVAVVAASIAIVLGLTLPKSAPGDSYNSPSPVQPSSVPSSFGGSNSPVPSSGAQCTEPIRLTINGEPISGTTVNAIAGTQNGCGVTKMAPEVNYTVIGNGKRMSATTCHAATTFPTSMGIAYDICGPECLEESFPSSCLYNVNGARNTWQSDIDQVYTISVVGRQAASTGEFAISVFDYPPPINNYCGIATLLYVNGGETMGSSVNATLKTSDGCGVTKLAPEVYYHVVGTGARLTVTTCSAGTSFETSLALFAETCVTECIGENYNDPICDNLNGASITWDSTLNITYEIEVFGRQANTEGDFAIRVFETDLAPTVSPISQTPTP